MKILNEKRVYIPHINYTVRLLDASRASGKAYNELLKSVAVTATGTKHSSTIYMRFPILDKDIATLCHEIIHVLQNIENDYGINIFQEREHMAYLFQYILNKFTGYEYI